MLGRGQRQPTSRQETCKPQTAVCVATAWEPLVNGQVSSICIPTPPLLLTWVDRCLSIPPPSRPPATAFPPAQLYKTFLMGMMQRHAHALMPHLLSWLSEAGKDALLKDLVTAIGKETTGDGKFRAYLNLLSGIINVKVRRCRGWGEGLGGGARWRSWGKGLGGGVWLGLWDCDGGEALWDVRTSPLAGTDSGGRGYSEISSVPQMPSCFCSLSHTCHTFCALLCSSRSRTWWTWRPPTTRRRASTPRSWRGS